MKNKLFLLISDFFKHLNSSNKIIAQNKEHLQELIRKEVRLNGDKCDLNHIDTSLIKDMSYLFFYSEFNGDISKWDVSNVITMDSMFSESHFDGDISKWNTSNVLDMSEMFSDSFFNGDISKWNVSKVQNMNNMFDCYSFKGDLSEWKPYALETDGLGLIFNGKKTPYWAKYSDKIQRNKAIDNYHLNKDLNLELKTNIVPTKRMKI